jgi:hypothetical protein
VCKCIHRPLLHSTKVQGLAASVLKPWGPEDSQDLCTPPCLLVYLSSPTRRPPRA